MGYGHGVTLSHGFKRERGVRKVFSNDMLAHVFAQQNQSEGQNNRGTAWFSGEWFYSYRTAIARIYTTERGDKIALLRDESFSVTTSQQMPSRSVFSIPVFCVPYIGNAEGQTRERFAIDWKTENARVFVHRWENRVSGERKRQPSHWLETLERRVSGHYWSEGERPANVAEAESQYVAQLIADLMAFRTQCLAYCDALLVAYPVEFASEAEARELATQQAAEIVARFRRVLDDPKNAARREAAKKSRDAKAGRYAQTMRERRALWLAESDDSTIEKHLTARVYGAPRAPVIPYWKHTGDKSTRLTKAQTSQAESILAELEADGQREAIRAKEARIEFRLKEEQRKFDAARFAEWQAGAPVHCPSSYARDARGGAYLRRIKRDGRDLIQTSQGAEVLFADAVRLFKFAKFTRARCYFPEMSESDIKAEAWRANGSTLRVSNFALQAVYVDGSCRVGCHFLSWESIADAARACGVFDVEPADTTQKGGHK